MSTSERSRATFRYMVDTGLAGQHLWFDRALIRRTFDTPESWSDGAWSEKEVSREEWSERVHRALEHIAALPSLGEQRQFVMQLPEELQARLCFHYFDLLDAEASRAEVQLH